jgi:hypothetical protein
MPLVYDNTRTAKNGGGYVNVPDANAFYTMTLPQLQRQAADALAKSQGRWKVADKIAMGAALTIPTLGIGSAIAGGATGAASVPGAVGASSAPLGAGTVAAGGVLPSAATATGFAPFAASVPMAASAPAAASAAGHFSLSNLMDLGKLGAGLYGVVSGNRANNSAQSHALLEQQREFDQQQQMLTANEATRKAEADRVAAESARQWNAAQQFQAQQFAAQEEQRQHDRALADAAEARKAPRRAIGQQALMRLSDFLGLARG